MNRMLVTSRATRRRRPAFNDRDEDNSGADFRSRINPFGSQDQERVPVGRFSPSDADWEALDDVPSPAAGRGRDRDWRSDNRDGEGSSRSRRADGPREQRWGPKGKGSRDGRDWSRGRRDERDWRSRGSPWARNERGGEGLGNPRDNLEGGASGIQSSVCMQCTHRPQLPSGRPQRFSGTTVSVSHCNLDDTRPWTPIRSSVPVPSACRVSLWCVASCCGPRTRQAHRAPGLYPKGPRRRCRKGAGEDGGDHERVH